MQDTVSETNPDQLNSEIQGYVDSTHIVTDSSNGEHYNRPLDQLTAVNI